MRQGIGHEEFKGGDGNIQSPEKGQSGSSEQNEGRQLKIYMMGHGGDQTFKGCTGKGRAFHTGLKHLNISRSKSEKYSCKQKFSPPSPPFF